MLEAAVVLSVGGLVYALLVALIVFIVAYVVVLLANHAGLPVPAWVAGALALIVFLLALLGGVTA